MLQSIGGLRLEPQYLGSLDAMASMARGNCEICGFHVPKNLPADDVVARGMKFLKPRTHRLIRLVTRTQGLFLAAGNPCGIASLADLARPEVHFVNRQLNSGTRLLFDLLLARARIDSHAVSGYDQVDFTHAAVAAFVASGMADTGFGVAAAARRFKLDFLPLAQETYFLACRADTLESPAMQSLLGMLRNEDFARRVADLPGYDAQGAGEVLRVEQLGEEVAALAPRGQNPPLSS